MTTAVRLATTHSDPQPDAQSKALMDGQSEGDGPRLRLRGVRLDYDAAFRTFTRGASAAQVAIAAGSRASNRANLRRVGLKIVRKLLHSGQVYETFCRLGYTIEEFCRDLIRLFEATKLEHFHYRGRVCEVVEVPDWKTRTAAADLYLRATGIDRLPVWADPPARMKAIFGSRPLEDWEQIAELTTDELDRLIELARDATA